MLTSFIFYFYFTSEGWTPCPKKNKNKELGQGEPSYYYSTYESYSAEELLQNMKLMWSSSTIDC